MTTVRIWDLPTRLFHWLLVASVLGLVITGNIGGNAMLWHFRFGYMVLTLLLFRLAWGLVGGHWSRWAQLPLSPREVLRSLREGNPHGAGHSPLGSWSVVVMLGWLLLQVGTGLFSDDEIANAGPLTALVSGATVQAATAWHKGPGKALLLLLVLVHLAAIAWYHFRKREPLVPAMLHGDKSLPDGVPASRDGASQWLLAVLVFVLCAGVVRGLLSLGSA